MEKNAITKDDLKSIMQEGAKKALIGDLRLLELKEELKEEFSKEFNKMVKR